MEKKYFGRVKTLTGEKNGKPWKIVKFSFSEKDFKDNEINGWVNLIQGETKNGEIYFTVDTWKPEKKEVSHQAKMQIEDKPEKTFIAGPQDASNDLPF